MPNLRELSLRHSRWFLDRLKELADRFTRAPESSAVCRADLNRLWAQIQTGQSWASQNSKTDAAAAFIASGFAALCADTGTSLLEVHQTQPLRAAWLKAGADGCRSVGDQIGEATHLYNLGLVLLAMTQTETGIRYIRKAKRTFARQGDSAAESAALNALGLAHTAVRKSRQAVRYHWQSLRLCRRTANRRDEAITMEFLGSAYHSSGNRKRAIEFLEHATREFNQLKMDKSKANALVKLSAIAFKGCNLQEARQLSREAAFLCAEHCLGGDADLLETRVATLLLQIGDPDVTRFTERALLSIRKSDNQLAEGMMLLVRSFAMAKGGFVSSAADVCNQARVKFRASEFRAGDALACRVLERLDSATSLQWPELSNSGGSDQTAS